MLTFLIYLSNVLCPTKNVLDTLKYYFEQIQPRIIRKRYVRTYINLLVCGSIYFIVLCRSHDFRAAVNELIVKTL